MQQASENQGFAGLILNYIQKLEADALAKQEKLNQDGRSPIRRFAEHVAFGTPEHEGAESSLSDNLALAPIQMAISGAQNTKEGIEEGKPLKSLGGAGMVAASALPFSSKIAAQLFSSIPKGLASGTAISASPILAEEALNASPAYAEGEIGLGEEALDKVKQFGLPLMTGAFGGGMSAMMLKTMMRNASIRAQKEMADLDRIATNRGAAKGAMDVKKSDPNATYHIQKDLNEIEPIIHRYRPTEDLAMDFQAAQNKALSLNKHADTAGAVAGGVGAGAIDYATNDEYDPTRSIINILSGALAGKAVPSASIKGKTPNIKSKIDRYYPAETVDKLPKSTPKPRKPRQSAKEKLEKKQLDDLKEILGGKRNKAHPSEVKKAIENRIKKGESVKDLAEEYGINPSNLYRWKRNLDD